VVYYPASRPEINGLVGPIVDSTAIMPCVAIVTPWDEATVGSETPVNLRYNVNGQLADYTYVFFSVDGGYRFTADGNGWISGLAPGWHTLVAWIGNVPGIEVPGTVGDTVTFFVQSASSSPSGETVEPAAAWPDNGQTVNASAYGAITPGLALRISGEPDARPATAVDTIVERPDLALLPLTPDTPRLQAPGAMWQTDVSGGAVDEAALDLSPGDRWLTELAEDVAAIGPCHDQW
jgi:hypothetical protein